MAKRTNRTRVVHWRLEPTVAEDIERMAEDQGESVALFVNDVLSNYVAVYKASMEEINES